MPDVSSCLGDSRERAETLDADHRTMCRYTSALDPNYRKVSGEIRAVYSNFVAKKETKGKVAESTVAAEIISGLKDHGKTFSQQPVTHSVPTSTPFFPRPPGAPN